MTIARLFYQSIIWRGLFFLSAFILNVLIARHYQASASGEIFYLINSYAFIILIVSLSLESAMGYYISQNQISITKLVNFSLLWTLLIAIGIFICIALVKKNISYTSTDFLSFTFICGNLLSNYCAGILYARKNFFLPNIIIVSINALLTIILLVMDFFHQKIMSDGTFLIFFFSSFLLQAVVLILVLRLNYIEKWRIIFPSMADLKKIFRFGLMAFAGNIVTFLLYRIDYWFVKAYCSNIDLGNYIQVSKLVQMFFILPGILAIAVFPLTAGGQRQETNNILTILSRIILLVYTFCCAGLAITGYWLFPFLFGNTFKEMYIPFLFLIPGILALSALYTLTAYYSGKNKMSVNLKGALIALLFVVTGDIFFISRYGINAAAAVSSIGYIVYHIYVIRIFTKEYNIPVANFFNFKLSDIQKIKRFIFQKY